MDEELLASHVDAIHGLPLDAFVPERDRRVKALRADGHREEAAALKAVRKPTVPAWAVNQVARAHPDEVAALLDAGDDLRAAQQRAASGRGGDRLRAATRAVRSLVDTCTDHARHVLVEAGAATGHHAEVGQTLFAAATDPDLQDDLRHGRVSRPVEASGFGVMGGLAAVPDLPDDEPVVDGAGDVDADPTAEEVEAAAREEARRREEQAAAERAAARRALAREVSDLEAARDRATARARTARQRADDLRERADAAAREADEAEGRLGDVQDELDHAAAQLADLDDA